MTSVALYSEQPLLTAGLQAVMNGLEDFTFSVVSTDMGPLMEHLRESRPSVILLDVTAAVTFAALTTLKSMAGDVPIVLWVNAVSRPFISRTLALGVRGVLSKRLPADLQVKCLRDVAAGGQWLRQGLCDQPLPSPQVLLTRRERELLGLLAQGLRNKEIAWAMTLTEGTVKVYVSCIFRKVGVRDRLELALFALKNSYVGTACESEPAALPDFMNGERLQAGAK
jgi:DNA-binding NarL/FixJ family response regulator